MKIFGDKTNGWVRVLLDSEQIWEGDTSICVIDANAKNGLGAYGIYVEVRCFPTGTQHNKIQLEAAMNPYVCGFE